MTQRRRPRWRGFRIGRAVLVGMVAAALNVALTPQVPWAVLVLVILGLGLVLDGLDLRDEAREQARARRLARDRDAHVRELGRLKTAVEDLLLQLDPAQEELLGDVRRPVEVLEERVRGLAEQGSRVDRELRHHDADRLSRQLEQARRRVAEADEGSRADEEATLEILLKQEETLVRVKERRRRIDARLRTAVGMLSALHLDLVELLSTDLAGASAAVQSFGTQLREVSRGVDALASALDEVAADEEAVAFSSEARSRNGRRGRQRARSRA